MSRRGVPSQGPEWLREMIDSSVQLAIKKQTKEVTWKPDAAITGDTSTLPVTPLYYGNGSDGFLPQQPGLSATIPRAENTLPPLTKKNEG